MEDVDPLERPRIAFARRVDGKRPESHPDILTERPATRISKVSASSTQALHALSQVVIPSLLHRAKANENSHLSPTMPSIEGTFVTLRWHVGPFP
jgi:hypothetical protein